MSNPNETTEEAIAELRRYADFVQKHSGEITVGHDALREYADRIEAAAKQEAIDAELKWTRIGYDERKAEEKRATGNAAAIREALQKISHSIWSSIDPTCNDDCCKPKRELAKIADAALAAPPEPPSNAAAMREALEGIIENLSTRIELRRGNRVTMPVGEAKCLVGYARAALAAPARNCDRYADELDAQLAFLNDVWLISVDKNTMLEKDKFENWTEQMKTRYGRWLLAPAKEGGTE